MRVPQHADEKLERQLLDPSYLLLGEYQLPHQGKGRGPSSCSTPNQHQHLSRHQDQLRRDEISDPLSEKGARDTQSGGEKDASSTRLSSNNPNRRKQAPWNVRVMLVEGLVGTISFARAVKSECLIGLGNPAAPRGPSFCRKG